MTTDGPVLVYGSCVARDTYELVKDARPLAAYVARQSLISAMSPPTAVGPTTVLPSPFQARMLTGDLTSSLPATLRQHAGTATLLLMDLVDERGGVYRLDDGAWITNTPELRRGGVLAATTHSRLVPFGTDRHFQLWCRAFDRFVQRLDRYGMRGRTVVIEAPFASRTVEGDDVPAFAGKTADEWNTEYTRYYAHVRAADVSTVRVPDEYVYSTREHKWHPDPYHYVEGAYRAVLQAVEDRSSRP